MKNVIKVSALCIVTTMAGLTGCKKDSDEKIPDAVTIKTPAGGFTADRLKTLKLSTETNITNGTREWKVDDQLVSTDSVYYFISDKEGTYQVSITVSNGNRIATSTATIQVKNETVAYKRNAMKVFDFQPAPGQFLNELPMWESGITEAQMIARAQDEILANRMVSLGTFGGYIVMGFDHAVMNVPGQANFRVLGNGFATWSEAGIIEVAVDANGNGLPDDEWFEIAGSEYNKASTIKDYEITYYKPNEEKEPVTHPNFPYASDMEYIKWTDNKGGTGYVYKNSFHSQSYYPQWKGNTLTFKGTKIANDKIENSSEDPEFPYWTSGEFDFGYADNWPNSDERSAIKLDWAVSKKTGQPVKLSGIHFVRVYTGLLADIGWLGELSTEVGGAEDLNIPKK
ncbi:cell surface protein [Pseudobacter ginsenosidimutans]|uniref:PKD family protein n=1 Tax=Pseudobacter ginsenosidimutans TaxID=661488 RepID=A0A4Q7N5P6_9BACT|nr:cell surface protein [Pseudobacter ginsenosidimutans]RZS76330.1 PKD family protein [Pseudobacter ginsenosidimutans]